LIVLEVCAWGGAVGGRWGQGDWPGGDGGSTGVVALVRGRMGLFTCVDGSAAGRVDGCPAGEPEQFRPGRR